MPFETSSTTPPNDVAAPAFGRLMDDTDDAGILDRRPRGNVVGVADIEHLAVDRSHWGLL
jgi:hypothetical protein